ncbi:hypothetical protein EFL48_00260 [Lactococcus cremoris]|uniref:hypothetical protein n=1 Tax=Lactococcus lactis subsp. cremoris TaxID=1359 RepID=UPI00223ADDFC|nr:hypothetical protein [Lactococcus cremoris]MCT0497465.1 hypothetical protein [Lactococcus cremoris]
MIKSLKEIEEKIKNDMIQRFEARVEWCLITKMEAMIFIENYGSGTIQDYFRDNYSVQEALVYSSKGDQDSKPFNSMYDWLKNNLDKVRKAGYTVYSSQELSETGELNNYRNQQNQSVNDLEFIGILLK